MNGFNGFANTNPSCKRVNRLSLISGGQTIVIQYKDGSGHQYTNIKNVKAYVRAILARDNGETIDWIMWSPPESNDLEMLYEAK